MQDYIEKAINGEDLTLDEAKAATEDIFEDATDAQIGSLL
ncbi:MAG: anthranilate phosphoribosyltransferase, partial [Halobacteria archaeon]|nr:anthranilate phosphoribosyltransferase [Halobacteria archaeon]